MRTDGVVVTAPAFDDDLRLFQCVEDFTVEQFVTQATSLTPIWRIASAILWPCETRTSTCRSFVTISSGLCLCVPKIRFCNIGGEGHRELGMT